MTSTSRRNWPKAGRDTAGYSEQAGCCFGAAPPAPSVLVRADPKHLQQVQANLISHAAKFSPVEAIVEIGATVQPAPGRPRKRFHRP